MQSLQAAPPYEGAWKRWRHLDALCAQLLSSSCVELVSSEGRKASTFGGLDFSGPDDRVCRNSGVCLPQGKTDKSNTRAICTRW